MAYSQPKIRGAGDVIAKITNLFGIKESCLPCKARQQKLNKLIPFGK